MLSEISINNDEIYALMGYGNNIPSQEVLTIIDDMCFALQDCCKPHFGYRIFKGDIITNEQIKVGDIVLNPGRIITYAMNDAELFAAFTATAGLEFDIWLKKIEREDDIVNTFIANTLGSVIAESAVAMLMNKLEQIAAEAGLFISNHYSPGYCDWLLEEQKKLLSLFPQQTTGIQLTDSYLMLPIKSVSGLVGIGEKIKKRPYGCDICKMKNCIKNKKKQTN
jgi:hypothetical protein